MKVNADVLKERKVLIKRLLICKIEAIVVVTYLQPTKVTIPTET